MKVISGHQKYHLEKGPVITIGNFDGIHLGHKHLINCVLKRARLNNKKSLVYTFHPHPFQVLHSERKRYLLCLPIQVRDIFRRMGLDCLIVESFTKSFSQIPPEGFIKKYIVKSLNPSLVIVGSNFHFGCNSTGDIHLLKKLAEKYHFSLEVEDTVSYKGLPVSSSLIRKMISSGQWDMVSNLLGRPFSMKGFAFKGFGRGKELGFPTINFKTDKRQIMPAGGVYISQLIRKKKYAYQCVVNIGTSPTFLKRPSERILEAHIIEPCDCESWLDKEYEIRFFKYIRPEKEFPSAKILVQNIRQDIKTAQKFFQNSVKECSKSL